jgi:hypothetical protein
MAGLMALDERRVYLFQCKIVRCGRRFYGLGGLKHHFKICHYDLDYCPVCGFKKPTYHHFMKKKDDEHQAWFYLMHSHCYSQFRASYDHCASLARVLFAVKA